MHRKYVYVDTVTVSLTLSRVKVVGRPREESRRVTYGAVGGRGQGI